MYVHIFLIAARIRIARRNMKGSLVHNAGRNDQIPRWPAAIGTAVMSALKRFVPRWLPSFLLPNFPFLEALSVSLLLDLLEDNETDACILSRLSRHACVFV